MFDYLFRLRFYFIIIVTASIIYFSWWFYFSVTPYVPVRLVVVGGDNMFVHDKTIVSKEHSDAICKILNYYNEYHIRKGEKIFIRRKLSRDLDLLQNYTSKACGLQEHILNIKNFDGSIIE